MKNIIMILGIIVGAILLFLAKRFDDNKILRIIGTVLLVVCISYIGV